MKLTFDDVGVTKMECTSVAEKEATVGRLRTVQKFFSSPKRWIKGDFAARDRRDLKHTSCSPESCDAACWCMVGGVQACFTQDYQRQSVYDALNAAIPRRAKMIGSGIDAASDKRAIVYNDNPRRTFAQIKDWMKNAIKLVKKAKVASV